MKAACLRQTGDASNIQLEDVAEPQVGEHQLGIRVSAASVNPIDTYIRSGAVEFDLPDPFFPGCDAAGVVEQVGTAVQGFEVGDRVWCTNQGLLGRQGTCAEHIAVDAAWCFPTPASVTHEDAAACALVGVTAHLGLFREAQLQPGETVLVIGGTGGVGSMVVQMAKAAGATVIATAGGKRKSELARDLGADSVIDYTCESIEQRTKALAPDGVNVFWETRRDPDFDAAIELLAARGRMVLMAGRDARPAFPVGPFYVKECSLQGFVMFKATPLEMKLAANQIGEWLSSGKLRSNIGRRFSLGELTAAHQLQESSTLEGKEDFCGKIVISME
ncbi:MAG: NADPH:quinone reductase [Planctomycetota bacterium]